VSSPAGIAYVYENAGVPVAESSAAVAYIYENAGVALSEDPEAIVYVLDNAGTGVAGSATVGRILAQVSGDLPGVAYIYEDVTT
jgi:hypothetical protein